MRFAILNNNYFNQLKYDVLVESALNDFVILNEFGEEVGNMFGGFFGLLKNLGSGIHRTINDVISWATVPNGQDKSEAYNKVRSWIEQAKTKLTEFTGNPDMHKIITGGAAVLAGLYLLKKFMSRKDKNQKIDSETINRANALANLPQDQARKMLMQMS